MAVIKVQEGWVSTETGHTYDSEQAARHYDDKELTIRRARMTRAEDEEFDRMINAGGVSADTAKINRHIKRLNDEAMEGLERKLTVAGTSQVIDHWLKQHEGVYVNSEHNGKQIALMLMADHGTASPRDTAAIDAAVEKLLRINALQLVAGKAPEQMTEDERYIASQRLLQAGGRAQSTPTSEPPAANEEDLYAMSLDELRQRSGGFHPLGPRG